MEYFDVVDKNRVQLNYKKIQELKCGLLTIIKY